MRVSSYLGTDGRIHFRDRLTSRTIITDTLTAVQRASLLRAYKQASDFMGTKVPEFRFNR